MTEFLAIGHSHLTCVGEAAMQIVFPIEAINFWHDADAIDTVDGERRLSEKTLKRISAHQGPILSFIGGSSDTVLGMLAHPRRFDFVLSDQTELSMRPEAEVLPEGAVEAMLRAHMSPYLELMLQVTEHANGPIRHFESPPPYEDAARISPHVPWQHFSGMRKEISPAPFRYKMWRLQSRIMREWCGRNGAVFVERPERTATQHGYLRDQFFNDGFHGNVAYGKAVLEQVRQLQ